MNFDSTSHITLHKYQKYKAKYLFLTGGGDNVNDPVKDSKKQKQKSVKASNQYQALPQFFIEYLYSRPYIFQSPEDCFYSGSFVFRDPEFTFYNFVKKNYFHSYFKTPKTTHVGFKKNPHIKIHNFNHRLGMVKAVEIVLNPPVYLDCQHTFNACPFHKSNVKLDDQTTVEKQRKGVIVMYRFSYLDSATNTNLGYTFFKLEAHKQFSLAHLKGAKKRYITGEKTQSRKVRREDSLTDCKFQTTGTCDYKIRTLCNSDSPQEKCQIHCSSQLDENISCRYHGITSDARFYDQKVRLGSEYFVPAIYTQKLLSDFQSCQG
jgi:hypothetical protein